MPRLSVWFVRTAFIYLVVGFSFGALMLSNKGVPYAPILWRLRPAHIELLLIGWMVQLGMGVAFWIFPRYWKPPKRGDERGAYLAYPLLNAGVWLVALAPLFALPSELTVVGRLLELAAAVAFGVHIWPRAVGREG